MSTPIQIIIDFLKEIYFRIGKKSPAFFKVLQLFTACLTFASYIPTILQVWFKVEVPGHVIGLCETIAHYATGFFAAAMLSAKPTVVAQTETGIEVKVTDENKLPFSAKKEQKEIAEKIPQPPVVDFEEPEILKDH